MNKSSIKEFFIVIFKDWLAAMSGPLSAAFSIASLFIQNQNEKIIWVLLGISSLIFTAYRIWSRERSAALKLNESMNKFNLENSPRLHLEIEQIVFGTNSENNLICYVQVKVKNIGAKSSVDKWEVEIQKDNIQVYCHQFKLEKTTLNIGSASVILKNEDSIYEKGVSPIEKGAYVRGWLFCVVPKFNLSQVSSFGTRVKINCVDIHDIKYTAEKPISGNPNELMYFPDGSGGPKIIPNRL